MLGVNPRIQRWCKYTLVLTDFADFVPLRRCCGFAPAPTMHRPTNGEDTYAREPQFARSDGELLLSPLSKTVLSQPHGAARLRPTAGRLSNRCEAQRFVGAPGGAPRAPLTDWGKVLPSMRFFRPATTTFSRIARVFRQFRFQTNFRINGGSLPHDLKPATTPRRSLYLRFSGILALIRNVLGVALHPPQDSTS